MLISHKAKFSASVFLCIFMYVSTTFELNINIQKRILPEIYLQNTIFYHWFLRNQGWSDLRNKY